MDDNTPFPFGQYKDIKTANVPASYLLWCNDQPWCRGHLKNYIIDNLDALRLEVKNEIKQKY